MDMIFLGMRKNGLCAFYVTAWCLYLYQGTFSFISDDEIYFQTRVFTEIIQFASHFCEDVGNEILKYSTFITEKVTSKDVDLGAVFKLSLYTHLRAHETVLDLVCRLLLEKKKKKKTKKKKKKKKKKNKKKKKKNKKKKK